MKFKSEKTSGLYGAQVNVTEDPPEGGDPFRIVATGGGIRLMGRSSEIDSLKTLDELALAISQGWKEHLKLKPKLENL